ncbi:hypothetical protein BD324DRAFT_177934 [Kockovaella imperatae]|uniref:Endoplasmic reticulum protein n=1 Tax=Kockovaella imperatae TaxID=4999 RepID=A0A1Y1U8C4_9TREE|nr:hypothetical protein BD324DRAFT_177934 [Kockovaella imperatae]ORX34290.1 hypothetical protein BD324DRAFT_177934 [Kockovaella imperatae]
MAVIDPHYLWAAGHAVMLLGSAYILLQTVFFRGTPTKMYRLSYTGALLSYAIVVLKSLGRPSPDAAWLRRAFVDENVQYMILALFWWISKPISITILPYATFSLFHCLTFLRTNVLPKIAPPPAAAQGQARPPPNAVQGLSQRIQVWVKANYDTAMRFVAYAELAIFARIIFGVVTRKISLMAPLFIAHFLRLRYHASPFTRQAVGRVTALIDARILPIGGRVAQAYEFVKRMIASWGGAGVQGAGQAAGPGAAGAAAAGGAGAGAAGRR